VCRPPNRMFLHHSLRTPPTFFSQRTPPEGRGSTGCAWARSAWNPRADAGASWCALDRLRTSDCQSSAGATSPVFSSTGATVGSYKQLLTCIFRMSVRHVRVFV
jgi:hypothetical protein